MDLVHPELRPALNRLERLPRPPLDRAWGRRLTQAALQVVPTRADLTGLRFDRPRPGPRVFRPVTPRSDAALLWIHGGGYLIGRARMDDRLCAGTARRLGVTVVSAEYRLAPEHPHPAPLDDCLVAWLWLQENAADLKVDPARVALGGQSAGGGLAAALVQLLVDGGRTKPLAQWLFCPMLDDRTAADRSLDELDHRIWNNADNRFGWRAYLGTEPGSPIVPSFSVAGRREDLHDLAPAWIGVGDIDLFRAEDRSYAERLPKAELLTIEGAPHGFESWAAGSRLAQSYVEAAQEWLAKALAV